MAGGRPLLFQTVEELQKAIDKYFNDCLKDSVRLEDGTIRHRPFTITGLALALGTTRKTLIDYEDRDEYCNTIKLAKTRVEGYAEERLFTGAATGPIFALKNFGWSDKSEQDINQRYVNKQGDDLVAEDLKIIADYEKRIKSTKED